MASQTKPYVDKDDQYRPQWYAEMMNARGTYFSSLLGIFFMSMLEMFHSKKLITIMLLVHHLIASKR